MIGVVARIFDLVVVLRQCFLSERSLRIDRQRRRLWQNLDRLSDDLMLANLTFQLLLLLILLLLLLVGHAFVPVARPQGEQHQDDPARE